MELSEGPRGRLDPAGPDGEDVPGRVLIASARRYGAAAALPCTGLSRDAGRAGEVARGRWAVRRMLCAQVPEPRKAAF